MNKFLLFVLTLAILLSACTGNTGAGAAVGDITCVQGAVLINGTCVFLDDTGFPLDEEVEEEEPEEEVIEEEEPEEEAPDAEIVFEVVEGDLVDIQPRVIDLDGDRLVYTYEDPFSETGKWQTKEGDAGRHLTTITVSDGEFEVTQDVLVIVGAGNKAPIIECEEEIVVEEGDLVDLNCNIYDPEAENVIVSYSGWMSSSKKQTDFDDEGVYTVLVKASDQEQSSSVEVTVEVKEQNRAPVIEGLEDLTAMETETVVIQADISDLDGDSLEITYSDPFDEDGVWSTKDGDSGSYEVVVSASDGKETTIETFSLTVTDVNTAPVMERLLDVVVDEGDTVRLDPDVTDPEGDDVLLIYSGWMTTSSKTTDFNDEGEYSVTITASDGELESKQTIKVTVQDKNRPPCFCLDPECSNC